MTGPLPPALKIFVVDDDDAVRDSIRVLLEVHGFEVEDYGSTGEFARHYRKPPRGCLILDQHLPAVTGVEFLTTTAGRSLGIPVILITGRGDPAIEQRAREAGVAEYLQKPVTERLLLATVERVTTPR